LSITGFAVSLSISDDEERLGLVVDIDLELLGTFDRIGGASWELSWGVTQCRFGMSNLGTGDSLASNR
jgi:hypothetical protein